MKKVTVIIPAYNRRSDLSIAIDSVLNQSYSNLELIVVDDASEEDVKGLVKNIEDSRIKYIAHDENQGGAAARNTGIKHANADLVAFLDSDDYWLPKKLEQQVAEMEQLPSEYVGTYCNISSGRDNWVTKKIGRLIEKDYRPEGDNEIISALVFPNTSLGFGSTLLVNRQTAVEVGGFDESLDRHQDIQFGISVALEGKLSAIEETLVHRGDSAIPSIEAVRNSKEHLYALFEEELNGMPVDVDSAIMSHEFQLGRLHISHGHFIQGFNRMSRGSPHTYKQYVRLAYSIFKGVQNKI
ncbi:glycosyltransferase family 2 protein [Natrinema salsiterrestre]|uniref:Glycosyltransferase n=1 Tax=Natrinema salsiterrestre TaxID=2950540 RepID=A0A9Q4L1Y1_9EURY|nr:glycosyltransferase family 2 protein [Natrinema salsiterrestre]MDF9745864.1 glycosyltransferase [Natrinema salsiterrestre]